MRIIQAPISDLIRASLLTAQGDIVVRGAGAPARLAKGAAYKLLGVKTDGSTLEYRSDNQHLFDTLSRDNNNWTGTINNGNSQDVLSKAVGASLANDVYLVQYDIEISTSVAGAGGYIVFSDGGGAGSFAFDTAKTTLSDDLRAANGASTIHRYGSFIIQASSDGALAIKGNITSSGGNITIAAASIIVVTRRLYRI